MKAAFPVAPHRFEVREVAEPEVPPDGLVLRVEACGICGSDLRRWREGPAPGAGDWVPGHEFAGVVVAVGPQCRLCAVGDRLAVAPDVHCGQCYYCRRGRYNLCDNLRLVGISPGYPGGFAEFVPLSGEVLQNGIVHPLADGLSMFEGALAEPCCSVLASHDRLGTTLGDTVAVLGAGPIGCLHAEVARARGGRVIISDPNFERRQLALRFDPICVVDPSVEDLREVVRHFTDGVGADSVICANAVAATHEQAVETVRKGGRVVLFGGLPKADPLTRVNGNLIHYGEIELIGSFSYHPVVHELALKALEQKIIRSELLITHYYALSEINQAFEVAAGSQGLKVMIDTSKDGEM